MSTNNPIPKILHHIWLGSQPFPEKFQKYREGWIERHPDWTFRFWTDDNLPQMANRNLFDAAPHPVEKSDILRLELLFQFGGLYVDTDFECLKNVEPLLAGKQCLLVRMTDKPMTTGFMACGPDEPFFERCVHALPAHIEGKPRGGLYGKTGPGYINRFVKEFPHVTVLPPHWVYPYEPRTPKTRKMWRENGAAAFPESYAVHHWSALWRKKVKTVGRPFALGSVNGKVEKALILGSGPSLKDFDLSALDTLPSSVAVICINDTIANTVRADVWFTLDPSARNQALMRTPRPGTQYFAAVPNDFGSPKARCCDHRHGVPEGITYLRRLTGKGKWGCRPGLSTATDAIHTGNSAYGALGLAFLLGARKIAILGVDGKTGGHFNSTKRTRDLSHLPDLFASAVEQLQAAGVKVVNGSAQSAVMCFPRCSPGAAVEWIAGEMDLMEITERQKYTKMWEDVPGYRRFSPARAALGAVLKEWKPEPGDVIADLGTGTGQAAMALHEKGYRINAYDLTEKCFNPEVRDYMVANEDFTFTETCLWSMAPVDADWSWCFDVMEHIPPEYVDAVLQRAAAARKGCVFQICTHADQFGKEIGEPLHLTVRGADWWTERLREFWDIESTKRVKGSVRIIGKARAPR